MQRGDDPSLKGDTELQKLAMTQNPLMFKGMKNPPSIMSPDKFFTNDQTQTHSPPPHKDLENKVYLAL